MTTPVTAAFPPPHACDCHVHVIGPKSRFPLSPRRSYTPRDAPLASLRAMLDGLRLERTVVVQPSIYGTDNTCLVDALAVLGARARGVAVVAAGCPGSALDDLDARGVRGLRLNLVSSGRTTTEAARAMLAVAAAQCARNGWHLQIFAAVGLVAALGPDLAALPVPVVVDHFGFVAPDAADGPEMRALLALLGTGRAFVKLSAAYRIAADPADPAVAALARAFAACPGALLWGTDWPHTPTHSATPYGSEEESPYRDLDTAALLGLVAAWFPEAAMQRRILVDNPARLYGW